MTEPFEVFSVRDLRNRASDLIRDAEEGKLAIITKHGRPAILAVPFDDRLLSHGVHRALALHLFEAGRVTLSHQLSRVLSDDEYRALQTALVLRPEQGTLIPGGGGLRKVRWMLRGKGKRGGLRLLRRIVQEALK